MKNIFELEETKSLYNRIDQLTPQTQPKWGKMSVDQILAHCNVTYEMVYTDQHPVPNRFMKFILKKLVKPTVVSDKVYKKNSSTAPAFIIKESKNFDLEKNRLKEFIAQTQQLGKIHFEGFESKSFGKLNAQEWNNLFYKHLDHHLTQFGA